MTKSPESSDLSRHNGDGKAPQALRTITEVAALLDVPQHVLRFWETRFRYVRPMKRAGGRRYYRPGDIALLTRIRDLLYNDGYTIKGVQKLIQDQGLQKFVGLEEPPSVPDPTSSGPAPSYDPASAQFDQSAENATENAFDYDQAMAALDSIEARLRTAQDHLKNLTRQEGPQGRRPRVRTH